MAGWHRALAYALTGTDLALPETDAPEPVALVTGLDAAGWDLNRIAAHARETAAADAPWPHLIPDALRAGLGAAQLHAALGRLRRDLGLEGLVNRGPSTRTTLTADERRLLADRPPHHVPRR